MERRGACIIVCAHTGYRRAARGLIGRAIRKALGVSRWYESPHFVSYLSSAECESQEGRFVFEATDEEMAAVMQTLHEMASAEGWDKSPSDAYHD